MPLAAGDIGLYQMLSLLGKGGMGAVYRVTDTKLDREVAIKVLPTAFAADAELHPVSELFRRDPTPRGEGGRQIAQA
jgi:serine/threonine protein kinase